MNVSGSCDDTLLVVAREADAHRAGNRWHDQLQRTKGQPGGGGLKCIYISLSCLR